MPVVAQDEAFTHEEITVTAEKREAELQKIPMSIDVVRKQEMRIYNVNQINDIQKIMPMSLLTPKSGHFNRSVSAKFKWYSLTRFLKQQSQPTLSLRMSL